MFLRRHLEHYLIILRAILVFAASGRYSICLIKKTTRFCGSPGWFVFTLLLQFLDASRWDCCGLERFYVNGLKAFVALLYGELNLLFFA